MALVNAAPPAQPQARPLAERQAAATVRIVRSVRVRLGDGRASANESELRSSIITQADGRTQRSLLIEFY